MALKLYVDTTGRSLVDSFRSQRLGAILPNFVQGDQLAVQLHFLAASGRTDRPFDYLDYSGKTVKLALGRATTIAAFNSDWTANPAASISVTSLSTSTVRVSPNLIAIDGTWELTVESAGPTTKKTGALSYNISAADLASALNALTLGQTVTVVKGATYWDITFPSGHAAFTITGDAAGLICENYLEGVLNLNTAEVNTILGSSSQVSDCVIEIQVTGTENETVQRKNIVLSNGLIDDVPPAPAVLDEYYNKEETDDLLDGKADAEHTHEIADVTGLQTELDSKLEASDIAGKADATDLTAHEDDTNNPHEVTKTQVGLGNVDNTSDVDKPVSAAQAAALAGKADVAHNHDASAITSGVFDIDRIPAAALERLVIVADETARFALTTATVQNGDVVKQTDTGLLYFVKDQTELDNAAGYEEFSSGSAASVPWTGVTGKPSILSELAAIAGPAADDVIQYVGGSWVKRTIAQLKTSLALAIADISGLVDALAGKAAAAHAHSADDVTSGVLPVARGGTGSSTSWGAMKNLTPPAVGPVASASGELTLDCSTGNSFAVTLSENITSVVLTDFDSGRTIIVAITNTASNYTVTWGNSIKWVGGTQPTQTIGAKTDVWTLTKVGATIYGAVSQNHS